MPLLYSLVFGEGVVNDATSVVLFRAVQKLALKDFTGMQVLRISGSFLQLFFTSTILGIAVSELSISADVFLYDMALDSRVCRLTSVCFCRLDY